MKYRYSDLVEGTVEFLRKRKPIATNRQGARIVCQSAYGEAICTSQNRVPIQEQAHLVFYILRKDGLRNRRAIFVAPSTCFVCVEQVRKGWVHGGQLDKPINRKLEG